MAALLRARQCHHIRCGLLGIRPGVAGGHGGQQDARVAAAFQLHLLVKVVRQDRHDPFLQQDGRVSRKAEKVVAQRFTKSLLEQKETAEL